MALLLRDVVGLSYNEIADSLEITLATVKWRIFKAREEVQLALAREGITFGVATGRRRRSASCLDAAARDAPRAPRAGRARGSPPASARSGTRTRRNRPRRRRGRAASHDARGSPSRGWPTEPGLSSQRPRAEVDLGRRSGASPPESSAPSQPRPSATWLWPTSTSGAVVSRRLISGDLLAQHVVPDRVDAGCRGRARRRRVARRRTGPRASPPDRSPSTPARPARRRAPRRR